jgi:hypothetical protein
VERLRNIIINIGDGRLEWPDQDSENLPALDNRSCRFGFSKVIRIHRHLKKDYAPWS